MKLWTAVSGHLDELVLDELVQDRKTLASIAKVVSTLQVLRSANATMLQPLHFATTGRAANKILENRALEQLGLVSTNKKWIAETKSDLSSTSDKGKLAGGSTQSSSQGSSRKPQTQGQGGYRAGGYRFASRDNYDADRRSYGGRAGG